MEMSARLFDIESPVCKKYRTKTGIIIPVISNYVFPDKY
jgi:hypothetical protein